MKKYIKVKVGTEDLGGGATKYHYPDWKGIDHRPICCTPDLTEQLFIVGGSEEELNELLKQPEITELTRAECQREGRKMRPPSVRFHPITGKKIRRKGFDVKDWD